MLLVVCSLEHRVAGEEDVQLESSAREEVLLREMVAHVPAAHFRAFRSAAVIVASGHGMTLEMTGSTTYVGAK